MSQLDMDTTEKMKKNTNIVTESSGSLGLAPSTLLPKTHVFVNHFAFEAMGDIFPVCIDQHKCSPAPSLLCKNNESIEKSM